MTHLAGLVNPLIQSLGFFSRGGSKLDIELLFLNSQYFHWLKALNDVKRICHRIIILKADTLVLTPVLAIAHTHTLRYSRAHTHTYTIPPDQLTHTHTLSPSGTREHTHTHSLFPPSGKGEHSFSLSGRHAHTLFSHTLSLSFSVTVFLQSP